MYDYTAAGSSRLVVHFKIEDRSSIERVYIFKCKSLSLCAVYPMNTLVRSQDPGEPGVFKVLSTNIRSYSFRLFDGSSAAWSSCRDTPAARYVTTTTHYCQRRYPIDPVRSRSNFLLGAQRVLPCVSVRFLGTWAVPTFCLVQPGSEFVEYSPARVISIRIKITAKQCRTPTAIRRRRPADVHALFVPVSCTVATPHRQARYEKSTREPGLAERSRIPRYPSPKMD